MPKKKKSKKGGKKKKAGSKKKAGGGASAAQSFGLWNARFAISEAARKEHRANASVLISENQRLQDKIQNSERDTIEVITYLKRQDTLKEDEVYAITQELKELKRTARKEKELMQNDYSLKINKLENELEQKNEDLQKMNLELKMVKEFKKKRAELQKDLKQTKEQVEEAEKEHKTEISRLESRFIEEKMRLQKDAERQISELADKAHAEAIENLDETTREIYKENVRLSEALKHHVSENEKLDKEVSRLRDKTGKADQQAELDGMAVTKSVTEAKSLYQANQILRDKITNLEASLSHVVREFEHERSLIAERTKEELMQSMAEASNLRHQLQMKEDEAKRIRKLAKKVLQQRSDIEQFFVDSLRVVSNEIKVQRENYRQEAKRRYNQEMRNANLGRGTLPKIQTFSDTGKSSNSIYKEFKDAEDLPIPAGNVDISDLTWEQRERVLRYLFAKINEKQKLKPQRSGVHLHIGLAGSQYAKELPPPRPSANDIVMAAAQEAASSRKEETKDARAHPFFLTQSAD